MKPIIKPVEFDSPLSEVEVRMTLKEMCGSRLYDYPFNGKVDQNCFQFIKNSSVKSAPNIIIDGNFFEQNGKTKVILSVKTGIRDIIEIFIIAIATFLFSAFGFVSMLAKGVILSIAMAVFINILGVTILAIGHFSTLVIFNASVKKIKAELEKS